MALDTKPHFLCSPTKRPSGLKYEKAREWRIPCVNAQWLGDILLGDFEALRQVQCSRYAAFGLPDPFAPTQRLVWSLLGEWGLRRAGPRSPHLAPRAGPGWPPASSPHCALPGPALPGLVLLVGALSSACFNARERWQGPCSRAPASCRSPEAPPASGAAPASRLRLVGRASSCRRHRGLDVRGSGCACSLLTAETQTPGRTPSLQPRAAFLRLRT